MGLQGAARGADNADMRSHPAPPHRRAGPPAPGQPTPILGMTALHFRRDMQRVAVPQVEAQLVVRLGPSIPDGLDIHVLGVRPKVQRKFIRGGQHALLARLQPGSYERALGASARELAGQRVALEDLWTRTRAQALQDQLAGAVDAAAARDVLQAAVSAFAARSASAAAASPLLDPAMDALQRRGVADAAQSLGISERQLRRILHDALGIGPKLFSRLTRFERVLRAARSAAAPDWAGLAVDAGYYDQAHLIAECRAIADSTPRSLLAELTTQEPH